MATVVVPSVWPPGSQVSITGQVVSGGAVVGGVEGHLLGTPVIKLASAKPVGGVPSAGAFGTVTISEFGPQHVPVAGLASAGAIGVPRLSVRVFVPGGVPSTAAFGTLGFHTAVTVQVPGVPSPYPAYIPSITGQVISGDGHVVGGVGGAFGFVTILARITVAVGGVPSSAQIGTVRIVQIVPVLGVPSAQQFGAITIIAGPVWIPVGGVDSSAQVGVPDVFIVWVRPFECTDLDLDESVCTDLDLAVSACIDLDLDVLVPT